MEGNGWGRERWPAHKSKGRWEGGKELMEGEEALVGSQPVRVMLPPLPPVLNDLIRGPRSIPNLVHLSPSAFIILIAST